MSSEEEEDDFTDYLKAHQVDRIDDFAAEMDRELDETVAKVEADSEIGKPKKVRFEEGESSKSEDANKKDDSDAKGSDKASTSNEKFYDDVYFDSDSDSDGEENKPSQPAPEPSKRKSRRKHPIPSDDDLFYDPEMDDADQKWIDDYRRSCQPKPPKGKSPGGMKPLPNSDAVLNCPACMSLLCLDCQRHSIYSTQYRAMFVQNCSINFEQTLNCPLKSQKKGKNKITTSQDVFHPVKCDICNTEVAVYDKDEVYHFFNVLSSYS